MKLTNRQYDILSNVALYLMPFTITVYGAIAILFNTQMTAEIVTCLVTINGALGVLLKGSSINYKKGSDTYE